MQDLKLLALLLVQITLSLPWSHSYDSGSCSPHFVPSCLFPRCSVAISLRVLGRLWSCIVKQKWSWGVAGLLPKPMSCHTVPVLIKEEICPSCGKTEPYKTAHTHRCISPSWKDKAEARGNGWGFFPGFHRRESWARKPEGGSERANWRGTIWEPGHRQSFPGCLIWMLLAGNPLNS